MKKGKRYDTSGLIEAQSEPGSRGRVLKNLLGIKSKREMDKTEAIALKQAEDELFRFYTKNHKFKSEDICKIHLVWLGNIYPWAGKYRNVNLAKGSFHFAASPQIPRLMNVLERNFLEKYTPCHFASLEEIAIALAEVHVELVLIHPFREGNGRVARVLSTLMALQAGLPPLNFRLMTGRNREGYFKAIQAGLDRNYMPMKEIFKKVLEDTTSLE